MTWQREVIQMTWRKWHGKWHDESDMGNVMTKVTWGMSQQKWHEKSHKMWRERRRRTSLHCQSFKQPCWCTAMKVIRHAGVDSRMTILDDQARQQMTLHFQLSLQCSVSPITSCMPDEAHDVRNTALKWQLEVKSHLLACLIVQNNPLTMLMSCLFRV